jgi:LEA14-like dessication related protein
MIALLRRSMWLRVTLLMLLAVGPSGCASLQPGEPPRVDVVGVEPLAGQGMEMRILVRLRVMNPNDTPIQYDGLLVDMEVRGKRFASGVSNAQGSIPRYGEALLTVPVTAPALAVLNQALGIALNDRSPITYVISGKLSGPQWKSHRFGSEGEFPLPAGMMGGTR